MKHEQSMFARVSVLLVAVLLVASLAGCGSGSSASGSSSTPVPVPTGLARTFITTSDGYSFVEIDGQIALSDYTGTSIDLVIPAEVEGRPVVGIYGQVFNNSYGSVDAQINSIHIPASIVWMGDRYEGHDAESPFWGCLNLLYFTVDAENPVYAAIDGVLFDKLQKTLVAYPNAKPGSEYAVPEGILSIRGSAFAYNGFENYYARGAPRLISVIIPEGVTTIGASAFHSCPALTSITLPKSLTAIDVHAFAGYENLTLKVVEGSYAAQYAKDNNIPYTYGTDWLN